MKKAFEVLKKYFAISFVFSIIVLIWSIVPAVASNALPTIDLPYIGGIVFAILIASAMLVPVIAFIDWCIVRAAKELFKDYKESDKKGRIIIIVICICILLRKILIWTR